MYHSLTKLVFFSNSRQVWDKYVCSIVRHLASSSELFPDCLKVKLLSSLLVFVDFNNQPEILRALSSLGPESPPKTPTGLLDKKWLCMVTVFKNIAILVSKRAVPKTLCICLKEVLLLSAIYLKFKWKLFSELTKSPKDWKGKNTLNSSNSSDVHKSIPNSNKTSSLAITECFSVRVPPPSDFTGSWLPPTGRWSLCGYYVISSCLQGIHVQEDPVVR